MPCRDWDDSGVRYITDPVTKERLDRATRVACEALKKLDQGRLNGSSTLSEDARTWWKAHQEDDRRREAAEAARRQRQTLKSKALAKLTAEEKKALGI